MPIDYTKYPPNWLSGIRPRIMKRANNKCEFDGCGLEHLSIAYSAPLGTKRHWYKTRLSASKLTNKQKEIKEVKVVITISHLDHDEENHDVQDERLMAMCQLHHLRYDAKEKYRRRNQSP